jgi:hypothetical protein
MTDGMANEIKSTSFGENYQKKKLIFSWGKGSKGERLKVISIPLLFVWYYIAILEPWYCIACKRPVLFVFSVNLPINQLINTNVYIWFSSENICDNFKQHLVQIFEEQIFVFIQGSPFVF